MARIIPGSGAVIEPIFNEVFGVKGVRVLDGGSGYVQNDPPRLTITGCGVPEIPALLYPIIDSDSGKISHVRVLEPGRGYDPLRVSIVPQDETPTVVDSFDINRIWQSNPNSETSSAFVNNTDRLLITSDNNPKPADIPGERIFGQSNLVDRDFSQTYIYRGGKDSPTKENRVEYYDVSVGLLTNGTFLHSCDWGQLEYTPVNFNVDHVRYPYLKNSDEFDGVIENSIYYHQSSRLLSQFRQRNGVFENGRIKPFVWDIKVEFDNVLLSVTDVDESVGNIEVGGGLNTIDNVASGEIAKIVRNQNGDIVRVYLRNTTGSFENNVSVRGSNGFFFRVNAVPITFPNGIFYINFKDAASEFGQFLPNTWYFAPENIQVRKNYLIIWNQLDSSNRPSEMHDGGHPMQFSKTPDGLLNQNPGVLYVNTDGDPPIPSVDYEQEFRPLFLMNEEETGRIYYYCKYHNHMSGYIGDEGYMVLDTSPDNDPPSLNDYYITNYYDDGVNQPDLSRYQNGHSKIIGISIDGYPIYGPWGYDASKNIVRLSPSYRLRNSEEYLATRPKITTTGNVTYNVTISNNKFLFDGSTQPFITLDRGKTYIFNQNDSSNDSEFLLFSTVNDGWQIGLPPEIGNTDYIYSAGVTYHIDGAEVTYQNYISQFNLATSREIHITPTVDSPPSIYIFAYTSSGVGIRVVVEGYLFGDFREDYIYEEGYGDLDEFNGIFTITPEYPNGTYAYFLTEDSNGNPVFPYSVYPKFYGLPIFEGDDPPEIPTVFPVGAAADVFIKDTGEIDFIKVKSPGDGYFGNATAKILGGEGSGAVVKPVTKTITGLSLLNPGRNFQTPPTIIFEGGGGVGARGIARIDTTGKIESINVVDPGEFYNDPPYIIITGGGGIGAKAEAIVDQGEIVDVVVTDPGKGYTSQPNIVFAKGVNLKRKIRNRQSFNSTQSFIVGLLSNITSDQDTIYVNSTDSLPGSGTIRLNNEEITYSSKSRQRLLGVTRGVNFRYDQRVIVDTSQNDQQGISLYEFNVGDRVVRRIESSTNKTSKVYDWNPSTRELLLTFEVDDLAFIDAGIPSIDDNVVQFDGGTPNSAPAGFLPHNVITSVGDRITILTSPIGTLLDKTFEDDDELDGLGDGIPDLVNTATDYANQISLDGGIYSSLYGIEETLGGQNTTLFQVGDNIKDASIPFKYATVVDAGQLNEGVSHTAIVNITLDGNFGNGQNYFVNETVTGSVSGIQATVVSWNVSTGVLQLTNIIPYDTGNINIGVLGKLYEFSANGTVVDFIVRNSGVNYSDVPTVTIEDNGDIQATATVNMTPAGDQVESVTVTNGGYGISQYVSNIGELHPTVTVTNAVGDTTGSGADIQAVLGGEYLLGNSGASYRIKSIEYVTQIQSQ